MTDDMMNGWDEIAAFLKCSVVTAWRKERDEGLPTIRIPGSMVRASRREVSAWILEKGRKHREMKEDERL